EGEILAFGDSPLQQFHALVPGCAVGVHLSQRWVGGHQLTGNLIGVVVFAPVFAKGRATYAALARAIDACDDVNARLSKRSHVKANSPRSLVRAASLSLAFLGHARAGMITVQPRLRAAFTAARPSLAGLALNAAAIAFLACGLCILSKRSSNSAPRLSRLRERTCTSDSNSS